MSLLSWGRHPPFAQRPLPCYWRDDLPACFERARSQRGTTLAYGQGRSYGDSCLAASDNVLDMRALDRFISTDWQSGTVVAEAGVTLEDVLRTAVPRGWFLPVTPGTKHVTLGGAVANDVHGKNHHRRGTFGRHVRGFGLLRSDRGRLACSPGENADLFAATIGGLGLSGIIEWVELQLSPICSAQMDCLTQRFRNLDEFFALSNELEDAHEFSVAWVDCAAKGRAAGRGIFSAADFAQDGESALHGLPRLGIPLTPPVSFVNGVSVRAFNALYWRTAPGQRTATRTGYDPFFYPLDAIRGWNRMYGPKGFQQYQCILPRNHERDGMHALLAAIAQSGTGSFLAVLKRCGDLVSPGLLSFPMAGTTLALDFPQSVALESGLFARLDAIVREAGGRLYPAKDAHMRGDDFRRAYPAWHKVEVLRDPALMSRFWERVTQ